MPRGRERTAAEIARSAEIGGASQIIGEETGDDPRFRFLLHLASEGAITTDDAEDIIRWTQPTDDLRLIAGLVAGEKGVSKRVITDALAGTPWEMTRSEITSMEAGWQKAKENINAVGGTLVDAWQLHAIGGMEVIIKGIGGITSPLFGEDGYYGEEAEAARTERSESQTMFRDEITRLLDEGDISKKKAKELRILTGDFSPEHYQRLHDELEAVYEEIDALDDGTVATQNSVLRRAIFERGPVPPGKSLAEIDDELTRTRSISTEGAYDQRQQGLLDTGLIAPGASSFQQDLINDGILLSQEGEPIPTRPRATYLGGDAVFDRSTGQSYSVEEWEAIKTDPIAMAKYAAAKVINPAVQEILNQPFFADQVNQTRTVNYRDIDGNWQTKEVFTGTQGSTGVPQIPIEDLAISALDPTNPWETSTFDYRVGDGRAEWMSFTSRERANRLKLMKDEGLLTEEQYLEMGAVPNLPGQVGHETWMSGGGALNLTAMALWEQATSLSSDTGYDPIQALRAIGESKRVTEANAITRTYGGAAAPKYSVPSSLRTIPDYKALAQESKGIFRNSVGRDLEDWELVILAKELGIEYEHMNEQMIVAHKAAWEDAVAGGTMDVDFTEVNDPTSSLEYDIEERYANELDRQERVEDRAMSRRILMDSITAGQRMG